jgi:predicted nucleic acid-binding protein
MTDFLLDTTMLIQLWRRDPNARSWLRQALDQHDSFATSVVNVAEVYAGARLDEIPIWDEFFQQIPVYEVSFEDGIWAGRRKFQLKNAGRQVELPDALIAAVAYTRAAVIVTENRRDFEALGVELVVVRKS